MDIKLCTRCFGRKIRRHIDNDEANFNYFPLVMDWVCEDCGYIGVPIVFCSEKDYKRFISIMESNESGRDKEN
jgi:hypothetical protein